MLKGVNTNRVHLSKQNLDNILKVVKTLYMKTNYIEDFIIKLKKNHEARISQLVQNTIP